MESLNQCLAIVVGTGDLGTHVANSLNQNAMEVVTVSRRPQNDAHQGLHLSANVVTGDGLSRLPNAAHTLVYCVAPDERTETAYRQLYLSGLQRVLEASRPMRLIFIGSTAVYGQDAGERVDESDDALATTFNGAVLRECEMVCQHYSQATALRLSGIYGPGRDYLIRRARAGDVGRAHWMNRIHIEDAAGAVVYVANMQQPASIYCVTDQQPTLERDMLQWLRAPEQTIMHAEDAAASGRRVSSLALRSAGWSLKFADYRAGYLPQLAAVRV